MNLYNKNTNNTNLKLKKILIINVKNCKNQMHNKKEKWGKIMIF